MQNKINLKFILSLTSLIILCLNREIRQIFPFFIISLILFFPFPINKKIVLQNFNLLKPIIFIVIFTLFAVIISNNIYQNFDFVFAIRTPIYFFSFIILTTYFHLWFLKLKNNINVNFITSLIITEIINVLFFGYSYIFKISNFSIYYIILFTLIISLAHIDSKKNILFFLVIYFLYIGISKNSGQSLILFISSLLIFVFFSKKNSIFSINFSYYLFILFPIIFIFLVFLFPQLRNIDSNVGFRLDAITYNLELIFSEPKEYFKLDRIIHPYTDYYQGYEDVISDDQKNVSTHNAIVDLFSKTTFIGLIFFIYFFNILKKILLQIDFKNVNYYIIFYLWIYLIIHLSLNQILRFNQITIMSFVIGYLFYFQSKNSVKNDKSY